MSCDSSNYIPDIDVVDGIITKEMIKEERIAYEKSIANTVTKDIIDEATKKESYNKFNGLLERAALYSSFLADKLESRQKAMAEADKPAKGAKRAKIEEKTFRQPMLVSGCKMRDYQLEGMEWLISLYDNGLNGILAGFVHARLT